MYQRWCLASRIKRAFDCRVALRARHFPRLGHTLAIPPDPVTFYPARLETRLFAYAFIQSCSIVASKKRMAYRLAVHYY